MLILKFGWDGQTSIVSSALQTTSVQTFKDILKVRQPQRSSPYCWCRSAALKLWIPRNINLSKIMHLHLHTSPVTWEYCALSCDIAAELLRPANAWKGGLRERTTGAASRVALLHGLSVPRCTLIAPMHLKDIRRTAPHSLAAPRRNQGNSSKKHKQSVRGWDGAAKPLPSSSTHCEIYRAFRVCVVRTVHCS